MITHFSRQVHDHAIDKDEQAALTQRMVNLMAERPRLDIELSVAAAADDDDVVSGDGDGGGDRNARNKGVGKSAKQPGSTGSGDVGGVNDDNGDGDEPGYFTHNYALHIQALDLQASTLKDVLQWQIAQERELQEDTHFGDWRSYNHACDTSRARVREARLRRFRVDQTKADATVHAFEDAITKDEDADDLAAEHSGDADEKDDATNSGVDKGDATKSKRGGDAKKSVSQTASTKEKSIDDASLLLNMLDEGVNEDTDDATANGNGGGDGDVVGKHTSAKRHRRRCSALVDDFDADDDANFTASEEDKEADSVLKELRGVYVRGSVSPFGDSFDVSLLDFFPSVTCLLDVDKMVSSSSLRMAESRHFRATSQLHRLCIDLAVLEQTKRMWRMHASRSTLHNPRLHHTHAHASVPPPSESDVPVHVSPYFVIATQLNNCPVFVDPDVACVSLKHQQTEIESSLTSTLATFAEKINADAAAAAATDVADVDDDEEDSLTAAAAAEKAEMRALESEHAHREGSGEQGTLAALAHAHAREASESARKEAQRLADERSSAVAVAAADALRDGHRAFVRVFVNYLAAFDFRVRLMALVDESVVLTKLYRHQALVANVSLGAARTVLDPYHDLECLGVLAAIEVSHQLPAALSELCNVEAVLPYLPTHKPLLYAFRIRQRERTGRVRGHHHHHHHHNLSSSSSASSPSPPSSSHNFVADESVHADHLAINEAEALLATLRGALIMQLTQVESAHNFFAPSSLVVLLYSYAHAYFAFEFTLYTLVVYTETLAVGDCAVSPRRYEHAAARCVYRGDAGNYREGQQL
jgi:hypothetical protein